MLLHSASLPSVVFPKKHNLLPAKDAVPLRKPKCCCCCTVMHIRVGFENVAEIAHNKVLIAAALSAAIGQISKPFTGALLYGNHFDFKAAFQAGGFPSTHSSAVVAAATSLGLERGFADSIFGIAVVYAGLVMYDAQGVRREVGNHAKTLNRIMPKIRVNSICSVDSDDLVDSRPGTSSSVNFESLGALLSEEGTSYTSKGAPLSLGSILMPSGAEVEEKESEKGAETATSLKESIGHTETEVIAGALLGFFVSLAVYTLT